MEEAEGLQFHAALVQLGVVHRLHVDRALSKAYFAHLKEIPLPLIIAALDKLGDHALEFFPKTEAIRELVDEIRLERVAAEHQALTEAPAQIQLTGEVDSSIPVAVRRHWFECNVCHDSGMRPVCPGGCADPNECANHDDNQDTCPLNDKEVERRLGAGMVGYRLPVKACECKEHNKTYQRNHPPATGPGFSRKKTKRRKGDYAERNYVDGQE